MSTNMDKLKEKMAECSVTYERLAAALGIDVSTFYRKLKSDGMTFTVGQLHVMINVLNLTGAEAASIFLWQNSQECEKTATH